MQAIQGKPLMMIFLKWKLSFHMAIIEMMIIMMPVAGVCDGLQLQNQQSYPFFLSDA